MPDTFQEFRPTIETLEADIKPPSEIICPVCECGKSFSNSSHLTLHKAKVHGVEVDKLQSREKPGLPCHYHCPVCGCYYNKERHFASYKLLKKHYGSVHGQKKFTCSKCKKGFGFDHARKRHEATCGVIYKCKTCECPYTTKEALIMHCSRKQHDLPNDVKETMRKFSSEKNKTSKSKANKLETSTERSVPNPQPCVIFVSRMDPKATPNPGTHRQILPKPVIETVIPMTRVTVGPDKISVEKFSFPAKQTAEIQTDIYGVSNPLEQRNIIQNPNILPIPKNVLRATTATQVSLGKSQANLPTNAQLTSTTGMQTNLSILPNRKRHCSIAETQTSGDFILKSAMASANIPFRDINPSADKNHRSPRSKVKSPRRQTLTTSEVQTRETFPPKKRRKRRNSGRQMVTSECNTDNMEVFLPVAPSSTSTEQILIDYVSSISTQTQKSFLEEFGHCRQETQPVQNSETQTSLSALFKNMRESLLTEENPTILTDLGISFNNTSETPVLNTRCRSQATVVNTSIEELSSESSMVAYTDTGTASQSDPNNSQSSMDFMPVQSSCFLDLLQGSSTSDDNTNSVRAENISSDVHPQTSKFCDAAISTNDRVGEVTETSTGILEKHLLHAGSPTQRHGTTVATQVTPQKHMHSSSSSNGLYFSTYSSTVDFGVQTNKCPSVNQSVLSVNKWNPCLASAVGKDMHTQTMTTTSVDFGAQTLSSHSSRLDFLDSQDNSQLDGQGPMLSSSAGTDMHTQTADDLLDFLMTNMETQTEDLFISGLGLADIETQTPAENVPIDTLVTTETQTNMQSLVHEESDLTLFTDMQTQTHFNVVEFGPSDLTDSHTQTNFELFSL